MSASTSAKSFIRVLTGHEWGIDGAHLTLRTSLGSEGKSVPKSELTGFAAQYGDSVPEDTQEYYTEMSINQIINGDVRHAAMFK